MGGYASVDILSLRQQMREQRLNPLRARRRHRRRIICFACLAFACLTLSGCSFFLPSRTEKVVRYTVKSGDTLSQIASMFQVEVDDLQDWNGITDPRTLRAGQKLRIPFEQATLPKSGIGGATKKWDPNTYVTTELGPAERYVGKLVWPTKDRGYLSSKFGRRWLSFHEGIDIAAATGTPIYAAHDGTVVYSGNGLSGYGNTIVVRGQDLLTVYAHNHRNRVRKGERVRAGERIGDIGATGKATGPHLHFEVRIRDKNGKNVAINPLVFYPK